MNELSKLGRAAVSYAERGWAVFPLQPHGKEPATIHGFKDATTDPEVVRRVWLDYPDSNIGIATGAPSHGLVVLDADDDAAKGFRGTDQVAEWESENGSLPETACAVTGRGGSHLLFIANKEIRLYSQPEKSEWHVDFRGDGGYFMAAPSIHPNGNEVYWDLDPDEYPIAAMDEHVEECIEHFRPKGQGDGEAGRFELPEGDLTEGARDDTIYRWCCSQWARNTPADVILAGALAYNRDHCKPPLAERIVRQKVRSATKKPPGKSKEFKEKQQIQEKTAGGIKLMSGARGDVRQTIENALRILKGDPKLSGRFWWSETGFCRMAELPLPWDANEGSRPVIDEDYAALTAYCERYYGLHTKEGIIDAVSIEAKTCSRNPVREWIESLEWDGTERIGGLLGMLGCKCDEYEQEVMRLWLVGAVARAYEPGIKFDYMPVLVGEQGIGKSRFASLFCPNREWYDDNFKTIEGDAAIEKLRGLWIAEFAELLATKRAKDVEGIKAFITSTGDSIRPKYGRETVFRPRCCVFIGTTNDAQFLTDSTGNRRFLPIQCLNKRNQCDPFLYSEGAHMWFAQAIAEAARIWRDEHPALVLPKEMQQRAEAMQERYTEEDPLTGIIAEYMDDRLYSATEAGEGSVGERVCSREIYEHLPDDYKRRDSRYTINDINRAMGSINGWVRLPSAVKTANHGKQRCWVPKR